MNTTKPFKKFGYYGKNSLPIHSVKPVQQSLERKPAEKIQMILKNESFDPKQIVFKKMVKGKMLYPTYSLEDKQHSILIQTPYVSLRKSPFYTKEISVFFKLYGGNTDPSSQEMNQIFETFIKLDKYTVENSSAIKELDENIKENAEYRTCVKESEKYGKYIRLRMNAQLGETVGDESLVVPVFYKTNYAEPKHRMHPIKDLHWILKPGKRMRFILAINKLWYNACSFGYGIKIIQMEIDDTLTDRFKMIQGNSKVSMFDKYLQDKRDKYEEFLSRRIRFGPTRKQAEADNGRILKIVSNTAESYLLNDEEEETYVPVVEI
ncbi:MAG: hypothetical protein Harvfovirus8_9 [Harvfovirus sp.]|uniref:Uncharacterized protein n=1 Tax=Harvfovirus sp. TaxID=2487768 RepID=A0A3G5A0W8_9VIRU|nr:MAG: hypothetical protein Harvfovirus8_9 [Harvfovirus sp.]